MSELIGLMGKSRWFSSLVLTSGNWQIPILEDDKEKTAFVCHSGLDEFSRMPFGLKKGPAVFQLAMAQILKGIPWGRVPVYLDDCGLATGTEADHLACLKDVFQRFREHGVKLTPPGAVPPVPR